MPPSPLLPVTVAEMNPASRRSRRVNRSNASGGVSSRTSRNCSLQLGSPDSSFAPSAGSPSRSTSAGPGPPPPTALGHVRHMASEQVVGRHLPSCLGGAPHATLAVDERSHSLEIRSSPRQAIFNLGFRPIACTTACCSSENSCIAMTASTISSMVPESPIERTASSVGHSRSLYDGIHGEDSTGFRTVHAHPPRESQTAPRNAAHYASAREPGSLLGGVRPVPATSCSRRSALRRARRCPTATSSIPIEVEGVLIWSGGSGLGAMTSV